MKIIMIYITQMNIAMTDNEAKEIFEDNEADYWIDYAKENPVNY